MTDNTETATLAGGCFRGMQEHGLTLSQKP